MRGISRRTARVGGGCTGVDDGVDERAFGTG